MKTREKRNLLLNLLIEQLEQREISSPFCYEPINIDDVIIKENGLELLFDSKVTPITLSNSHNSKSLNEKVAGSEHTETSSQSTSDCLNPERLEVP